MGRSIFTEDYKPSPYWWEEAPRPLVEDLTLPRQVDVAVIGSGVTGLSAALVASYDVGFFGQDINDLALTFVTPLATDHHEAAAFITTFGHCRTFCI